jgi:hypothetical protein
MDLKRHYFACYQVFKYYYFPTQTHIKTPFTLCQQKIHPNILANNIECNRTSHFNTPSFKLGIFERRYGGMK